MQNVTSAQVLEWLVTDVAEFEARHWERAPLLISRESPAWYDALGVAAGGGLPGDVELMPAEASCLFSHARLLEILRDAGPLPYHASMRVVRSERGGGGRAEAEPPPDGLATEAWVAARLHEGYTVQLFRPQLHCSRLWSLLEALECRFQCLSGASVYLTPPGCQGLAPHHDDVEVFILQVRIRPVHIYGYVFVCVWVYIYTYIYVYTYVYIHIHTTIYLKTGPNGS